jgi:hypothetical protein
MIKKGSYVEISQVILDQEDRAKNIPEDTKKTPLKLWAKGWLLENCDFNKCASIKTVTGRILEGEITEVNPEYTHDFGEFIPEIMSIGINAKALLWGDEIE